MANWRRREGHRLNKEDIEDIFVENPNVLVVGTGYAGNMRVDESLRRSLEGHDIEVVAQKTHEAVKTFNKLLSEGKDVAGAFHLTCCRRETESRAQSRKRSCKKAPPPHEMTSSMASRTALALFSSPACS